KTGEERQSLKVEMDKHSIGRKARREGTAEVMAVAFPETGSIAYSPYWMDRKRAAGCNADNAKIATDFRRFCREKGIRLDAAGITRTFIDYCSKIGMLP
ncbi:hypothetical protein, partial [Paracoccus nototheniae]